MSPFWVGRDDLLPWDLCSLFAHGLPLKKVTEENLNCFWDFFFQAGVKSVKHWQLRELMECYLQLVQLLVTRLLLFGHRL